MILQDEGALMDARTRALGGSPKWFRTNLEAFSHASCFKTHDWMQLVLWCGDYVFHDLFPLEPLRMKALHALSDVLRDLINATSAFDSERRDNIEGLKLRLVETMCLCEVELPSTELSVLFHVIIHMPDCIRRWNSVRNFWCFFSER